MKKKKKEIIKDEIERKSKEIKEAKKIVTELKELDSEDKKEVVNIVNHIIQEEDKKAIGADKIIMTKEVIDSLENQLEEMKAKIHVKEQINDYKKQLGMEGRSLSLKHRKDKDIPGKIEGSVNEISKYY